MVSLQSSASSTSSEATESWLFETMVAELVDGELGLGFIYSLLARLAERYHLSDAVVVLTHESFGTQSFRLGGRPVPPALVAQLTETPGVLCEPAVVPEHECDAVRTASQLALSLHLARFNAGHDPLTGVDNRRTFDHALDVASARSARYGWAFTLVVIDLDDFKALNDRAGHAYGDSLLRQFAFALRRSVRSGDTAARLGGDEFGVILASAEGVEASGFLDRLRVQVKAATDELDFTVGWANSPTDSTDPEELYRIADHRLYEKKRERQS